MSSSSEGVIHLDVSDVSKAYSVLGGFIVIYGLISYVAKDRLYMSEPLIAVTVGIIAGPYVLGWVDPRSWGSYDNTNYVTYELTRLVVGVQVLFTGISLPMKYLRKEALSLTVLLLPVMTTAWLVCGLLIWGLIPNVTFLEGLCIAAAITPTDPVLANSITKGRFADKHVPTNLKHIILAESGANDGLGFPFLYLALYLVFRNGPDTGTSIGTEVGRWVYAVVIFKILLSCVYGTIVGVLAHKTLKWAETRGYIDRDNFFAYGFGLALFTLGTTGLYNSDDILACFVAGNAFTWKDWYRVRTQVEEQDSFQDILDSLLNTAVFIYIGAIIPWDAYNSADSALGIAPWRIVVLGICVLLVRRLPWVVALSKLIPAITSLKEAFFAGHFGPIGVGAVFYIEVALREIPTDGSRDRLRALYTPVVLFIVFSSVLVHGVTIPIAKLGPNVVRRTTSLSARRTISFTSRPSMTPRNVSPTHTSAAGDSNNSHSKGGATTTNNNEKEIWNPLWSAWIGLGHVALFWRKDSFWRRPSKRQILVDQRGKVISAPKDAKKSSSAIEERVPVPVSNGEPALEEATPIVAQVQTAQDQAPSKPEQAHVTGNASASSLEMLVAANANADQQARPASGGGAPSVTFGSYLQEALRREMRAERKEARDEAKKFWAQGENVQPGILNQQGQQEQSQEHDSAPGTPGGSRVRFQ